LSFNAVNNVHIVNVLCQTCIGNESVGYASVIEHWKIN